MVLLTVQGTKGFVPHPTSVTGLRMRVQSTRNETYVVAIGDLSFLRTTVEQMDQRARADVEKVKSQIVCRTKEAVVEFLEWTAFIVRANALGLTRNVNLMSSLRERIKVVKWRVNRNDTVVGDNLRDDWTAIHTPNVAYTPSDDFDIVDVEPDEWAHITATSFEVDTQVIVDTVIKGKWTVKDGKCHFLPASHDFDDHLLDHGPSLLDDYEDDDDDDLDDDDDDDDGFSWGDEYLSLSHHHHHSDLPPSSPSTEKHQIISSSSSSPPRSSAR